MKKLCCICTLFLASLIFTCAVRGENALPSINLQRVQKYFEGKISSRYMEQNCQPTTYDGWEGFPIQLCSYAVKDKKDGTRKSAQVILLDASPEKLARWVVTTCLKVKGTTKPDCTDRVSKRIISQSGAQFPVAGIVFEDILPVDGVNEIYCFRNGVTVSVPGVPHRSTRQPTPQEQAKSLHDSIASTFRYARIVGTTREEYIANGGKEDVQGNKWIAVVKKLYQDAFNSVVNELMIAWAKKNL